MAINNQNIYFHELIGLDACVINAKNESTIGVCGKVIDETQKSILLRKDSTKKRVMKNGTLFELTVDGKKIQVEGNKIAFRPWERLSK